MSLQPLPTPLTTPGESYWGNHYHYFGLRMDHLTIHFRWRSRKPRLATIHLARGNHTPQTYTYSAHSLCSIAPRFPWPAGTIQEPESVSGPRRRGIPFSSSKSPLTVELPIHKRRPRSQGPRPSAIHGSNSDWGRYQRFRLMAATISDCPALLTLGHDSLCCRRRQQDVPLAIVYE